MRSRNSTASSLACIIHLLSLSDETIESYPLSLTKLSESSVELSNSSPIVYSALTRRQTNFTNQRFIFVRPSKEMNSQLIGPLFEL